MTRPSCNLRPRFAARRFATAASLGRLLLVTSLLLPACSKKTVEEERYERSELQQIWMMYRLYAKEKKRPPMKLADLRLYERVAPAGAATVARGEFVVRWGTKLVEEDQSSSIVVAYEKNAPQEGGFVLLANGKIQKMTASECQAAIKATS
jgi:hypothetical protein